MQMMSHLVALGLIIAFAGCSGEKDVCSRDRRVSLETSMQNSTLADYCAYKASLKKPGPPLGELAKPLGRRGKEAVSLWITDMETGSGLYKNWEYGPILSYSRDYTGYRLCSDNPMLNRAKAGLKKYYREAKDISVTSMIGPYC